MKVLLDSHSTVTQNTSGGLQVRILEHFNSLIGAGIETKLFNKWEDKIVDYDIYHLFKVTKDCYSEILYAKQKGVKVVVSAVIPVDNSRNISISLLLARKLKFALPHEFIRKSLELADVITTQTQVERRFINRFYKIDLRKIIVIPNGVSSRFITDEPKVSFAKEFAITQPYVLQVGRVDKNKNQLNVIRAMADTDIPLVIVGGMFLNEKSYYENCKRALGKNMQMVGWIDHKTDLLLSAFREAKVCILPSIYETFGNVLIEAGVSGANLVCSETLPINEYSISQYWTKVDPYDISSIREAILKEYAKEKNDFRKGKFIEEFKWENIIQNYIKLYQTLT